MSGNKKAPLGERIEEKLDEALYKTQNAIYGEKNGSDDVPYTREDASGFRRPISFATRRNLALRLIKKPWFILAFIAVLIVIGLIIGWAT